jgi:hypothetical protein
MGVKFRKWQYIILFIVRFFDDLQGISFISANPLASEIEVWMLM